MHKRKEGAAEKGSECYGVKREEEKWEERHRRSWGEGTDWEHETETTPFVSHLQRRPLSYNAASLNQWFSLLRV